ncbi:MAG: MerR family transcriptional regulator [bacterium]
MHDFNIPDKLYFRIGEVAKLIGVEPYVLRYWETEFPEIAPTKSRSKQRLYKRQDVQLICEIRDLLYNHNYTIKGAKKQIKDMRISHISTADTPIREEIHQQLKLDDVGSNDKTLLNASTIKDIIQEMTDYLKS